MKRISMKQKFERIRRFGNSMVKIASVLSTCSLMISSILIATIEQRTYQAHDSIYGIIIWYSLLGSMWVLICSSVYLIVIAIYNRLIEKRNLNSIRKEITFLIMAISSAVIFALTAIFVK